MLSLWTMCLLNREGDLGYEPTFLSWFAEEPVPVWSTDTIKDKQINNNFMQHLIVHSIGHLNIYIPRINNLANYKFCENILRIASLQVYCEKFFFVLRWSCKFTALRLSITQRHWTRNTYVLFKVKLTPSTVYTLRSNWLRFWIQSKPCENKYIKIHSLLSKVILMSSNLP